MFKTARWETQEDLANERAIVAELRESWGFSDAMKLPIWYHLDYALLRDGPIWGMLEAKRRNLSFGYGDGYYIAVTKLAAAREFRETCGLPSWLAVRFSDDVVRWAPLRCPVARTVWAGRKDRPSDPMAMEPHGVIVWGDFKNL